MSYQPLLLRVLVASTVLVSAGAASAQAPTAQDLVGTWNMTLTSPQGTHPTTFTIKEEAGQLSGSVSGQMGTTPLTVKTSDTGVTMSFTVDYQGEPLPIVLTGKLAGAAIKGVVDFGNGAAFGAFEGTKGGAATNGAATNGSNGGTNGAAVLTGTWVINSDGGSGWSMHLAQDGPAVTGTLENADQGISLPLKGTLENGALDLAVIGDMAGTIKGTLEGSGLKGSYDVGGNTGSWSASRKP